MSKLQRISITIEQALARKFDGLLADKGYSNRSEAVRDLIRKALVENEWESGGQTAVGTLTIVYDHSRPELARRLLKLGHAQHDLVISTMHVHLDTDHCLEVMALKGKPAAIKKFTNHALGAKGVKHGDLVMTTTGKQI
jgi:CopG family nickel-responsive transcriptional regulator